MFIVFVIESKAKDIIYQNMNYLGYGRRLNYMYNKKISALGLILLGVAVALSIPKELNIFRIISFIIFMLVAICVYFSKK